MSDFEAMDLSSWEPEPREPLEPQPSSLPPAGRAPRPPADEAPAAPKREADPPVAEDPGAEAPAAGPVAWKAAASSVPKLRQKPVELPAAETGTFQGFAQDALPASSASSPRAAAAAPRDEPVAPITPLMAEPPFWEIWLDRLRIIPMPVALGACAGLLLVAVVGYLVMPRDRTRVSLARIQQQPEAFDGRMVHVRGRAGIAFSVGGSYVFELSQGRDTIVVYSHSRRPRLNEEVTAVGTVSVGYLDGVARVALLEGAPTP